MKNAIPKIAVLAAFLWCGAARAQTNDAQLWENINIEKHVTQNFIARFSHEGRITDNYHRFTYGFGDFGVEYKIPRTHLAMMLDYVYIRKLTNENWWSNRHQYYTALTWTTKFGNFKFHDRQMLMGQVKDIRSSIDGKVPEWYLRNKATLMYRFNFYWSVYAAEELYWRVPAPTPDPLPHFNRVRYFVGGYFRPDKRSEFELYYLFEQHLNIVDPNHNYVIGIGYTLSL